jgi:sugar phosphate isomerase/epimerase
LEQDSGGATVRLSHAIEVAATLEASSIYMTTGGRGSLCWEQAAERFANLLAPCRPIARDHGVNLLVETASPFNAHIHIAHTFADTLTLAELADIGVCMDVHAFWFESELTRKLQSAVGRTHLVQVSDYVLGDRSAPCRAVPGDGVIPLQAIVTDLLEAGYEGVFDLELLGPRIQEEGPHEARARGARYLSDLLIMLGA